MRGVGERKEYIYLSLAKVGNTFSPLPGDYNCIYSNKLKPHFLFCKSSNPPNPPNPLPPPAIISDEAPEHLAYLTRLLNTPAICCFYITSYHQEVWDGILIGLREEGIFFPFLNTTSSFCMSSIFMPSVLFLTYFSNKCPDRSMEV